MVMRGVQVSIEAAGFFWERDGEALLRRYKPSWFERPVLPSVTPISRVLSDQYRPDRRPSRGGKRR
jgi:hypothetical protein